MELFLQKNLYLSGLEKDQAYLVAHNTSQFKELFHYNIEDNKFDVLISNKSMYDRNKQITKHSHDLWQI